MQCVYKGSNTLHPRSPQSKHRGSLAGQEVFPPLQARRPLGLASSLGVDDVTTLLQVAGQSIRLDRLAVRETARAKVRLAAQGAEHVTNVVGGVDAGLEGRVPPVQDALDDLDAGEVDVVNGRVEAALVHDEQVVVRGHARRGAVEVGGGAHDDDAGEVDEALDGGADHGLERGVVLLRRGAVVAGAVGPERRGVVEGVGEQAARVVHVAGGRVAEDDRGGLGAGGVLAGVPRAVGGGDRVVGQVGLGGEAVGQLAQVVVDLEDLGAVPLAGEGVGQVGVEAPVARGEVGGHLARVEFVLQRDLNSIPSERHTTQCAPLGADTSDPRDHEVGLGEIELVREHHGRDGGGSVDLRLAGRDLADLEIFGAVDVGEQHGQAGGGDVDGQEIAEPTAGEVLIPDIRLRAEHADDEELGRNLVGAGRDIGGLGDGPLCAGGKDGRRRKQRGSCHREETHLDGSNQ